MIKQHLNDLKIKLFYFINSYFLTFSICYYYKLSFFYFFSKEFINLEKKFIFTGITTAFWTYFKMSFWLSFIIIVPYGIYLILLFYIKAIPTYQIRFLLLSIFSFFGINYGLLLLFFNCIFNQILYFFLGFEMKLQIVSLTARIDQYVNFVLIFILFIFTLCMIPVFILIANYFITNKTIWLEKKKQVYIIFILAFIILAPADVFLQALLIPFCCIFLELFFFFYYLIKFIFDNINEESRIRTYDEY